MKTQLFPGKFEIQGEIAKGQTGTIYYGYDLELRQEVAIKIYHSHINGRLIRGKTFVEKSKPLLRLEHPNLIKIFQVEEKDDTPIVFMEFFDAPSLQQLIYERGPLPVEEMLLLAREIAEVLVHTHLQGIIHGTLHPGHVLVGPQNRIKVMDLGLSWILMDILSNCDVDLLRPLPYLPPEIAKGELLNVSSDLYCLGFMMYDMLTKQVPYTGLPKTSIMGKLAFDQADPNFDFPEDVPEAICELIRHMTRNRSENRLQDATYVLTILNQQLGKFAPDPVIPNVASSEPQPAKESPTAIIEPPAHGLPTEPPDTLPNKFRVEDPPVSTTTKQGIYGTIFKKLGITLGIILLMVGVITMGYWYRELFEISSGNSELANQAQPRTIESLSPLESDGTSQIRNSSLSTHKTFPVEEHTVKTDEIQHGETSPIATQPNIRTNKLELSSEFNQVKRPSSDTQKTNGFPSAILQLHSDSVPAQSNASQQESSSISNQPNSHRILAPAIPRLSLIKTEPDQQLPSQVPKEPIGPSDFPSVTDTEQKNDKQGFTQAFPMNELMEPQEKKEFPKILEAIDTPESVPTPLPAVQPPLFSSPTPSAPSSADSFR